MQTHRFTFDKFRLLQDGKAVPFVASPNISAGKLDPRFIVMHYTAGGSAAGAIATLRAAANKVSAHFVMDRDGSITQMVDLNRIAWHAGKSKAVSKWGTWYSGINPYAIGIEMVNYGFKASHVPASVDTSDWPKRNHFKESFERQWQPYTNEQHNAARWLVAALMKQFSIPAEHVVGHDEISLIGKTDPGPLFDMNSLRTLVRLEQV